MSDLLSGWQGIAGSAIIISIIISGIALGAGRAFSLKRLERFGADELIQSVINAGILGFAVGLSALVLSIGAEFAPDMGNVSCASNITPPDYVICGINASTQSAHVLSLNLVRVQNNIGYYQTLEMKFGNFSIQPLANMDSVSTQLGHSLYSIQLSSFVSAFNAQFLSFVSSNWFGAVFATGLVLRSFFLSRKFGAFLISVSITLIIFYPLAIMMFPSPIAELSDAENAASTFLSNSTYATVPIMDLNDNNAIASKIYNMSFANDQDYVGDLSLIVQKSTDAAAAFFFYSTIVPIFALIAAFVLIKELSNSFAGEIAKEVSQV